MTRVAAAIVACVLSACGGDCARGPTTTCWCPGDAVGQSTCGEDGLYGACVCPGAVAPAVVPAPVAPAPVPPPPVSAPPPSGNVIPAVAPPPSAQPFSGLAPSRDSEIAAWIVCQGRCPLGAGDGYASRETFLFRRRG